MGIFKDCDIRGVYPTELNEQEVYRIGRGLATVRPGDYVVGGDVRLSTPALKERLIAGLVDSGARVVDVGTIATPMLYFALKNLYVGAAGATVTASHNPPKYNGVKFMLTDMPVTTADVEHLRRAVEAGAFTQAEGTCVVHDIRDAYIASYKARFAGARKRRIVVDAGNGAMSGIAALALAACGHEVVGVFDTPDGAFPNRAPNPAEYGELTALSAAVRDARADFGVAFDGDGDRAVFADERGDIIQSERALSLFIRYLLRDKPSPVVYDQKSSSIVRRAILEMGGTPVMERSGHTFIKRRFLELGSALAGEVSGHFFFGELGYDDALFAALLMTRVLDRSDRPLSELLGDLVCPPITPDIRIPCPYAMQDAWLARMREMGEDGIVSELDGVRVEYPDGWALLRKSVTGELMTLRAEANTQEALTRLLRRVRDAGIPVDS